MSIYLRKALRAGPFRFNVSKSGVGVSAGVTGLRLGISPRGTYVHAGRGGLYYRKFLSSSKGSRRRGEPRHRAPTASSEEDSLEEIESADLVHMVDSDSEELISEFRQCQKRIRFTPIVLVGTLALELWLVVSAKEVVHWGSIEKAGGV